MGSLWLSSVYMDMYVYTYIYIYVYICICKSISGAGNGLVSFDDKPLSEYKLI